MADPVISDATLRAWRGTHNRTYRDLERAGRAGTEAAETEAELAGLRAAITQHLAEHGTLVDPVDLEVVLDQRTMHDHQRPGIWDDDNRPGLAGTRCGECAARVRLRAAVNAARNDRVARPVHVYLSTGCFHDRHDYCAAMTGQQGAKRPAICKFCPSRCICPCHAAQSGPAEPLAPDRAETTELGAHVEPCPARSPENDLIPLQPGEKPDPLPCGWPHRDRDTQEPQP